jgi:hypothetical protein
MTKNKIKIVDLAPILLFLLSGNCLGQETDKKKSLLFTQLPTDIAGEVLIQLDPTSLRQACKVCRSLRDIGTKTWVRRQVLQNYLVSKGKYSQEFGQTMSNFLAIQWSYNGHNTVFNEYKAVEIPGYSGLAELILYVGRELAESLEKLFSIPELKFIIFGDSISQPNRAVFYRTFWLEDEPKLTNQAFEEIFLEVLRREILSEWLHSDGSRSLTLGAGNNALNDPVRTSEIFAQALIQKHKTEIPELKSLSVIKEEGVRLVISGPESTLELFKSLWLYEFKTH